MIQVFMYYTHDFDQINIPAFQIEISALKNLGSDSALQNYIPKRDEFCLYQWSSCRTNDCHVGPMWISGFVLCFVIIIYCNCWNAAKVVHCWSSFSNHYCLITSLSVFCSRFDCCVADCRISLCVTEFCCWVWSIVCFACYSTIAVLLQSVNS